MSATAATARYVIAADDKTKAAIASINAGFRGMERGIKATVSRLNASLGLIAGVGLKRAFQSVFTETAKGSKEFSAALDDVRASARDLLSAKDGVPGATAAMKELAEVLKDPATVQAADSITSTLITGFAKATEFIAKTTVGLQVFFGATGDELENISHRVQQIDALLANKRAILDSGAVGQFAANTQLDVAALEAERSTLTRRSEALSAVPRSASFTAGTLEAEGFSLSGFSVPDLNLDETLRKQFAEFNRIENLIPVDDLQERMAEFVGTLESGINEGVTETTRRAADSIDDLGDVLGEKIELARRSAVFVEEMQRSLFGNVSDLLASAGDGADDFGRRTIDTFKKILADKATLQLFDYLATLGKSLTGSSGGSGFSGLIGAGLTALFGGGKAKGGPLEQGKWYIAGERGPEPIWGGGAGAYAMGYGKGGSGVGSIYMPVHIDARGATQEAVKLIPGAINTAVQRAKAEFLDMQRRGQGRR